MDEWLQIGGFINCYGYNQPVFREDESVYYDWLKENNLIDTTENQIQFCRLALIENGTYSDSEIEKLLTW